MDDRRTWHHRLTEFLHLIRWWNLLIAAAGFLLSYSVWIYPLSGHPEFSGELLSPLTLLGISFVIMYMLAFGYIHNDWRDRLADKINVHDRPLVHHQVSRGKIILTLIAIGLIAWAQALWIGWVLNKMEFALLFPLIPAGLYLYNRYLKHRPLAGNLLIAFFCAAVPWIAWMAVPNPEGRWELAHLPGVSILGLTLLSALVFLCILAREIVKDLEDRAGDLAAGSRTLPIAMGADISRYLVTTILAMIPAILIAGYFVKYGISVPHWLLATNHTVMVIAFILLSFRASRSTRRKDYGRLDRWIKTGLLVGTIDLIYVFGPWNY